MPSNDPQPRIAKTTVAVYVCTYRRNIPLARMLDSLEIAARHAEPDIELGVVVIDDNADGSARAVVDEAQHEFPLGLHYVLVGAGNIATARNAGLEAAMGIAEWVAMVDDDQVVVPEWLSELVRVQRETEADAVTAPVYAKFPDDSPEWLSEQPFADLWGTPKRDDGAPVTDLQTANSMIRTSFLEANPTVRFSTDLGEVGGEDMVFYRGALDAGLKAHYSRNAVNWELESADRATYRYQLRRCLWHGNTEAVTNLRAGRAGRARLLVRAAKRAVATASRPVSRLRAREDPQWRYALAVSLQSVGMVLGAFGIRLTHR